MLTSVGAPSKTSETSQALQALQALQVAGLGLATALCGSCGGRSAVDPNESLDDPPVGCITVCEGDEVCDDGVCEPLNGCPQPQPPRLVYSSERRFEQLIEARVRGTSFLTQALFLDPERTLIDLAGARTVVQGGGHFVRCRADLDPCYAYDSGTLVAFSEYRLTQSTWKPGFESEFNLPGGAQAIDPRTLLVWDANKLLLLDIYSKAQTVLASYDPMNLAGWILPTGGTPGQLFGIRSAVGGGTVEVAEMIEDTKWRPVIGVTDANRFFVFVPAGDSDGFLLQDVRNTENFRVTAVREGSPQVVSELADPIISAIAERYAWGREPLEAGHIGYGITCTGKACEYKRVDLDTIDVTVVDDAVISDKQSVTVSHIRPLPCDAVDVLLRAADNVGPIEYWAARFTHLR